MPGCTSGTMILTMLYPLDAPSIYAASSSDFETVSKKPFRIQMDMGSALVEQARISAV